MPRLYLHLPENVYFLLKCPTHNNQTGQSYYYLNYICKDSIKLVGSCSLDPLFFLSPALKLARCDDYERQDRRGLIYLVFWSPESDSGKHLFAYVRLCLCLLQLETTRRGVARINTSRPRRCIWSSDVQIKLIQSGRRCLQTLLCVKVHRCQVWLHLSMWSWWELVVEDRTTPSLLPSILTAWRSEEILIEPHVHSVYNKSL